VLRDYLELIRLPAVFTAPADVVMGFFFVTQVADFDATAALTLGLLVTASCLLYSAGMVINDLCDYREDCRDRPERPLPSGRVSRRAADRLGVRLLVAGVLTAVIVSVIVDSAAWEMAVCLCCVIVGYDLILKRTLAGPLTLGICRALNVLLGMSAVGENWEFCHFYIAGMIGLFVVGVSVLARGEAGRSRRAVVLLGIILMMAAVGLLAWLPNWRPLLVQSTHWYLFVVLMAILVAWRCHPAMVNPAPAVVQRTVGQSIRALVVLDAAITLAVAGAVPGVAVLLLLVPSVLLSRWFYST